MVIDINSISPQPAGKSQNNGANNAVPAKGTAASTDASSKTTTQQDSVEISSTAQELNNLRQALQGLPEVDETRVEQIQQQIAEGKYSIDASEIAARIIDSDQNFFV